MISSRKSSAVRYWAEQGLTNEEIGEKLSLKQSSVRRYLRHARERKSPKVLLFDIETAPVHVRVWGLFKQKIEHYKIIDDWFVLGWAGKWLDEEEVMSDIVTPMEARERDDGRIIKSLWKVIDEADLLVAHNLERFDLRRVMARFIEHGLHKPRPFRVLDTLKQAQKHFAFSSHKLDHLTRIFSLRMKEDTEFQLWIDCEEGDKKALAYMQHYNESDIWALQDLYLKLRPYMTSHPNLSLFVDDENPRCPHCLSEELIEDGSYTTDVSVFPAYRCLKCGATPRGRKSKLSKEKRSGLLVSTAR